MSDLEKTFWQRNFVIFFFSFFFFFLFHNIETPPLQEKCLISQPNQILWKLFPPNVDVYYMYFRIRLLWMKALGYYIMLQKFEENVIFFFFANCNYV